MYAEHRLDVYGTALFLATTKKDWRELAKRTSLIPKRHPTDACGQVTSGVWHPDKRGLSEHHIVIWIDVRKHDDPGELVDTICHEASHVAGRILERAGHEVPGTDEPHAYLCGWIAGWIWENCE